MTENVDMKFMNVLGCERTGRDNASDKQQNCRLSHASKFGVFTQAPCVRATNRYGIMFIGIWHHIYWNMASYYWNVASYLWEYDIIFIGMWHHIYWNMASYLLERGIIFIGI